MTEPYLSWLYWPMRQQTGTIQCVVASPWEARSSITTVAVTGVFA
jgi:hypothetical protein